MQVEVSEMIAYLREFSDTKETGMFMIFMDNTVATVGISEGEFTHWLCNGQTGMAAFNSSRKLLGRHDNQVRIRFNKGPVQSADKVLPNTETLLQLLADNDTTVDHSSTEPTSTTDNIVPIRPAKSTAKGDSGRRFGIPLTDEMKIAIKHVAADYLGNKADAICDNLFSRVNTLRPTFLLLAGEFTDVRQAEEFKNTLRTRLRPLTQPFLKQ